MLGTVTHYQAARLAVDKAKLCPTDQNFNNPSPRVGIVLVKNGVLLGWAAKGFGGEYMKDGHLRSFQAMPQEHAEQALLDQFSLCDITEALAYVTLEPCTRRKSGISCAERLIAAGIAEIYIANCDPNPDVGALAWQRFHSAGVVIRDFPGELRNEARRDNTDFFNKFRWSRKEAGGASFDYEANGGKRILGPAGKEFITRWTNRGQGSIYALDYDNNVNVAKN